MHQFNEKLKMVHLYLRQQVEWLLQMNRRIDMYSKFPGDALASRNVLLQRAIEFCKSKLSELPEGRIKISHREGINYYYYVSDNKKPCGDLLKKEDKPFADKLAQRAYLESVLKSAQKEEKLLELVLNRYPQIPYLYERPVKVGNRVFHTDFTILRMSDRKELYLEHLGRLGDPGYAADAVDRMNRYHMNGFIQGDNLFFTYESENAPFDVRMLDVLIEEKFR